MAALFLTSAPSPAADCTESALAAAIAAGGTTTFGCSGQIDISEAMHVTNSVVLEATGDVRLVGMGDTRLFEISTGASLTLSNFTLSGGETTNGGGGAIFSRGVLVLLSCTLSNNVANGPPGRDGREGRDEEENNGDDGQDGTAGKKAAGGAIYNLGTFRAVECGFYGNRTVGGNGGAGGSGDTGIFVGGDGGDGGSGGTAFGGAVFNGNRAEIINCAFYFNDARGGDGAAGATGGDGGFPGFDGNGGRGGVGAGGALYATNKATTLIVGCTFSENTVLSGNSADAGTSNNAGRDGSAGGSAFGGGFCNYGSAVIINSTFNANEIQAGNGGDGGTSDVKSGDGGDGGAAWGANVFNGGRGIAMTNCTINGGIGRPGTNGLGGVGTYRGDDGHIGNIRGANVGNGKGKFVLSHTILVNPASTNLFGTNTTVTWTTNIYSDVRGKTNAELETCTRILTTRGNGTVIRDEFNCVTTRVTDANSNLVEKTVITVTTNVTKVTVTDSRANGAGAFKDGGYNLSSDRSISFKKKSTSQANKDPRLGPLADLGGPTETMEPQDPSPAIDAGDPNFSLEFDQRGIERPQGYVGDIGAVEVKAGPPETVTEPEDVTLYTGENASFSYLASGRRITYQWYFNDMAITGATNATLVVTNVQLAQAGAYHAVATNPFGEIASADAILDVSESAPILTQVPPASTNITAGTTLTLVSAATGSRPLHFQWHFTDQGLVTKPLTNASATNATLTIPNFGATHEGTYTVEVTNVFGTIFSDGTMVQRIGTTP
jgi:hypothetical protein